ncbi:putative ribonuclease H-like domain-containing protein [Tanacetum coccineum]
MSFKEGKLTRPLFFKRYKGDICWSKFHVDDIIFGSTKKELCNAFEKLMHEKFQMSSKGELIFFLGLQLEQKKDGIFISQDKYDENSEEVDVHMYRSMISSLMYLTSSRPDIMFAVSATYTDGDYAGASLDRKSTIGSCQFLGCRLISWQCKKQTVIENSITEAKYVAASSWCRQATDKEKIVNEEVQLQALVDGKKIIITESTVRRDLQLEDAEGVDCLPNATIFEQLALIGLKTTAWNEFSSTMASVIICLATNQKFNFSKFIFESMVKNLDNVGKVFMYLRRETPLFPTMVVHNQEEIGEGSTIPTDTHHTPTFIQPSPQPQKTQKPRRPKKKDTQVPQSSVPSDSVIDEAVYKELDDSLVRAATTASSLEAEQDSGGGPRCQETIGDTIIQTRSKNLSKLSNDPLLARGNTLRSGKDSLKLYELMALCTTLQIRVLDLEITKTTQGNEIASQKRRVKKLERRNKSRTHKLKRLYKVGLTSRIESSRDEEDLVNDDNEMFDMDALAGEGVFVIEQSRNVIEEVVVVIDAASTIPVSAAIIIDVEITLAQALAKLKNAKPKADKDKGKGIMVEETMLEQVKPIKRLKQMRLNEELAFKLQAEEEEEERLAREKAQ